jgi:hypothetical protein
VTLQGWYLTQATQRMDRSVPLVAHRDAVLRVFLLAPGGATGRPAVRVTVQDGASTWTQTIPASGTSLPAKGQEDNLAASCNLPVPGSALLPGARIRLEVDPERQFPGLADAARLVEAPLEVREVPVLKITLVPVRQSATGSTGEVVGPARTLESWLEVFRKVYPVADVRIKVGAVLTTTAHLDNHDPRQDQGWFQLLGELEQRRAALWAQGDTGEFVYGVVKRAHGHGTVGLTPVQSPVSAGWDAPNVYRTTFAHEMGHALGRAHAPFNLPANEPLGDWPVQDPAYAQASLGAVGLDVAAMAVKAPGRFKDIMSYADPALYWVSDHTYLKVMAWREQHPAPARN